MRAMKTTSLTFGPLVNIPVRMYKAVDDNGTGFHQHHGPDCLGQIKMVRTCEDCGAVVEYKDIVKGTTVDDKLVIVTDDELTSLEDEIGSQIEIVQFCDVDEVDPMLIEAPYYLEPNDSLNGYTLLRSRLEASGRVGIVRFVMTTKTRIGMLRPVGNVLVLHTLRWIETVRSAKTLKGLDKEVTLSQRELDVAAMLMDSMTAEFDPASFEDGYTARLKDLIAAKADGAAFHMTPAQELDAAEDVSDLLAKLEASVKAAPKKRPAKPRRRSA